MANNNIKQNIKSSALELFSTIGYEATSIRDLSAKANCSLPMMYYYYESKEKLLTEIISVDFIDIINRIFSDSIKSNDLRAFVLTFIDGLLNLTVKEKQTAQIALRLHMGTPKHEALNKTLIQFKFAKESAIRNLLFSVWRTDKNIEEKTHILIDIIYNAMICILLTNRQLTLKQIDADIRYLIQ